MKTILRSPIWSAVVFVTWLLLARSASAGHLMLGLALAIAVPFITANVRPARGRVRRPLTIVRYVVIVGYQVVKATIEVAWGVIVWRWRRPDARFVVIPLELRDPRGLAVLAMVTTVVPGTVWAELATDLSAVRLHVWDVRDERAFVDHYKGHYERPLREIFE